MEPTIEYRIAEAYARGRTDAGNDAFMDADGISTQATCGAFAFRYAQTAADGVRVPLAAAWSAFEASAGRTVEPEVVEEDEEHMATPDQVAAVKAALGEEGTRPGVCNATRTYMGTDRQVVCRLRAGHKGPHVATADGRIVSTWTKMASDEALMSTGAGQTMHVRLDAPADQDQEV